ncbi:MAG: hypothetical protein Q8Q85_05510 [Gemmatimonadales bacterium]|nr:hypothetical protein [Gemmatimonadales bacterium]
MRFMMLLRADKNTEAGMLPSAQDLEIMGKYNEELVKAGVLLAAEGLHPSSKGARGLDRFPPRPTEFILRYENGDLPTR